MVCKRSLQDATNGAVATGNACPHDSLVCNGCVIKGTCCGLGSNLGMHAVRFVLGASRLTAIPDPKRREMRVDRSWFCLQTSTNMRRVSGLLCRINHKASAIYGAFVVAKGYR